VTPRERAGMIISSRRGGCVAGGVVIDAIVADRSLGMKA
jgi:hypothetical protein